MSPDSQMDLAYFPGCSLATTAAESNASLMHSARILGLNLLELADWNCCGSSSAPSLSADLSPGLAARNLSLVPAGRPLVVMCPRCLYYLRRTRSYLKMIHKPTGPWKSIGGGPSPRHGNHALSRGPGALWTEASQPEGRAEFTGSEILPLLRLHGLSSRRYGPGKNIIKGSWKISW